MPKVTKVADSLPQSTRAARGHTLTTYDYVAYSHPYFWPNTSLVNQGNVDVPEDGILSVALCADAVDGPGPIGCLDESMGWFGHLHSVLAHAPIENAQLHIDAENLRMAVSGEPTTFHGTYAPALLAVYVDTGDPLTSPLLYAVGFKPKDAPESQGGRFTITWNSWMRTPEEQWEEAVGWFAGALREEMCSEGLQRHSSFLTSSGEVERAD